MKTKHEPDLEPDVLPSMQTVLVEKLGSKIHDYLIPPPVFTAFKGKFLHFDPHSKTLTTKFPILKDYLNPYKILQGGVIAALVDNTIGPLSVLVAPANVTRRLEMKYSLPVMPELGFVLIKAKLIKQEELWLHFKAIVREPSGKKVAAAKATHWIIEEETNID